MCKHSPCFHCCCWKIRPKSCLGKAEKDRVGFEHALMHGSIVVLIPLICRKICYMVWRKILSVGSQDNQMVTFSHDVCFRTAMENTKAVILCAVEGKDSGQKHH